MFILHQEGAFFYCPFFTDLFIFFYCPFLLDLCNANNSYLSQYLLNDKNNKVCITTFFPCSSVVLVVSDIFIK